MIFEVRKGRACNVLVEKQEQEIKKLGAELVASGDAIKLLENKSTGQEKIIKNLEKDKKLHAQESDIEKQSLINKIKKLGRIVIIESGVIVVIIILFI